MDMDTTSWLLDSDPSIRWQVMSDLLERPEAEVARERARVATQGHGAHLLSLQDDAGYWNHDEYGENQDRRSVLWTLALLRRLGADPMDPAVRTAVDRVEASVTWRYWDNLPYFHGEVEPCINGGVLGQGAYFGRLGAGSDRLVARLLSEQLPDGGWNCEAPEGSAVSSFDSTLCVLEGLLEYGRTAAAGDVAVEVAEARARGEEYLLARSLHQRLSTGALVEGRYLNFSFPPYWFYDVLRALDYFREAAGVGASEGASDGVNGGVNGGAGAAAGGFDARLEPAIERLLSRRGADGRWNAGVRWPGEVYLQVDAEEGAPSRWNTLRALRVLRWAGTE